MPKYDLSPRERKLQQLQVLQQGDAQAQAGDLAAQQAMMQQMAQLYQMQQQQQLDPLKMQALQASTAQAQAETANIPLQQELDQRRAASAEQQLKLLERGQGLDFIKQLGPQHQFTPYAEKGFATGAPLADLYNLYETEAREGTPEEKAARLAEEARVTATAPPPTTAPNLPGYGLGSVASAVPGAIPKILQGLGNSMENYGQGFWAGLLGIDPTPKPVGPKRQTKVKSIWPWASPYNIESF